MEQEPKKLTIEDMKTDLQLPGIVFLSLGVLVGIFMFISLEPNLVYIILSGICIIVGILNLTVKSRRMFMLNGIVLFVFGIVMMFNDGTWLILVISVYVGILAFVNYGKYADVEEYH